MPKYILTGTRKGTYNSGNPITAANLLELGGGKSPSGAYLPLSGGNLYGTLYSERSDTETILESLNTSSSNSSQFYIRHSLGNVEIGNNRGNINFTDGVVQISGNDIWHQGNLINVSQLVNDAGYITSETDSQTLTWVDATDTLSISGGNSVVISGFADVNHEHDFDYVPYTGANSNVDLGVHKLTTESINVTPNEVVVPSYNKYKPIISVDGNPIGRLLTGTWNGSSFMSATGTFLGDLAGASNKGTGNTLLGTGAGEFNVSDYSVGVGFSSLKNNTGVTVVGVGINALMNNTGQYSIGIGATTLINNTGRYAIGIGGLAGGNNSGDSSISMGYHAGENNSGENTFFAGYYAGDENAALNVVGIGLQSAYRNIGHNANFLGVASGQYAAAYGVNAFGPYSGEKASGGLLNLIGWYTGRYVSGTDINIVGSQSFKEFNADYSRTRTREGINTSTNQVTITAHGFGSTGSYVTLEYDYDYSPMGGLSKQKPYVWKVVDSNTLEIHGIDITSVGSGTHTLTPQKNFNGVNILGSNIEPTRGDQTILGGLSVVAPSSTITEIDDVGPKALITKEYLDNKAYLTTDSDSQTLSWDDTTYTLGISNGNNVVITGFSTDTHTHTEYVPYTGATGNVDIGSNELTTGAVKIGNYSMFSPDVTDDVFNLRRYAQNHTLLNVMAPPQASWGIAHESTIALVRGDANEYFMDIYNMDYGSTDAGNFMDFGDPRMGIRMQKRGTGVYTPFNIEYGDGTNEVSALKITPNASAGTTNDTEVEMNRVVVLNSTTSGSFIKSGGTSTQFLKADGSVDSNTYDNYDYWNLKTNGIQRKTIGSNEDFDLTAGSNTSLSYSAGGVVTINSTDTTYSNGGGIDLAGTVFSHADTSSQASVNNSNAVVIQDILLDTYGHITGITSLDLDGRYYTETESDSRFFNVTGDTVTGTSLFTGQTTFDGTVIHDSANGLTPFYITRYGGTTSEYLSTYIEDIVANFVYREDERNGRFRWTLDNSDTNNAGANANLHTFEFVGDENEAYLALNGDRIVTAANIGNYQAGAHTHTFASLTSKPTTVSGYGITDNYWDLLIGGAAEAQIFNTGDVNFVAGSGIGIVGNGAGQVTFSVTGNYADASHTHAEYAATSHTHAIGDVTNLQSSLDGKVNLAGANTLTGNLTLSGGDLILGTSSDYLVAGNRYAFRYSADQNYGMFFNSTSARVEIKGASGTVRWYSDVNGGNMWTQGIITASGGTSTDWNTAFGWGDHSTAGYLTSVAWGDVTGKPKDLLGSIISYGTNNRGMEFEDYDGVGDAGRLYFENNTFHMYGWNGGLTDAGLNIREGGVYEPVATRTWVNAQGFGSGTTFNGGTITGDIVIDKANPWITLDSMSSGGSGVEQGAGISIGENGYKGAAAVHITYTGDGYGHIGMGTVGVTSGIPANKAMELFYQNNVVKFMATPNVNGTNVSLDGHTHSYLPLSGGTVTGATTFNVEVATPGGIATGNITLNSGKALVHNSTSTRDKIRVWTNDEYAIGMQASYTFGGLADYAMTFQMNNDSDRGFWWGDTSHSNAQGAMSLTTDGRLAIAHSIRLGYGEGDTTAPGITYKIDANGSIKGTSFVKSGGTSDDVLLGDGSTTSLSGISGGGAYNGGVISGTVGRSAHNVGHLEGGYNNIGASSTNTSPIYTIGSGYNPTSTALSNMYGIGYANTAAAFITSAESGSTGASGWGMYVAADGNARIWLNGTDGSGHFKGGLFSNGNAVLTTANEGAGNGIDADSVDGLHAATGRNNVANQLVRTNANGYIDAGWINTTSGTASGTISRIYCSQDDYLRYLTPATFRTNITDGYYPTTTGSGASGTWGISITGNAATATTAGKVTINSYDGTTLMRVMGSHQTGGSDTVYSTAGIYMNCSTDYLYAADFVGTSDERQKENITTLEPKEIKAEYKEFNFIGNDQLRTGVIAQELEKTHPEFVRTREDGVKSVSYQDLHSAEIAYLKAENKSKDDKIQSLEERINKLEELINKLT